MENKKVVLFVDDEESVRGLAQEFLESAGYGVVLADKGDEAIQKIQDGLLIDLIVMDINMPGFNGVQTGKKMIDLNPSLAGKIIYQSGVESYKSLLPIEATFLLKSVSFFQDIIRLAREKIG